MKRAVLWLAFVLTLIAVYFAPGADDTPLVVQAKAPKKEVPNLVVVKRSGERILPEGFDFKIRPRNDDEDLGNVFASHTWAPPPPKITAKLAKLESAAPPEPEAPPLPFQFLGRWVDDGKTVYFLQFNGNNLAVHIGDTIDKTYTLESAKGGTLTFAYLPLNKKQTLVVGEVN